MRRTIAILTAVLLLAGPIALAGCRGGGGGGGEITVPVNVGGMEKEANQRTCEANQRTIDGAIQAFYAEKMEYPKSVNDLVSAGLLKTAPTCPEGGPYRWVSGNPPYVRCSIAGHNIR